MWSRSGNAHLGRSQRRKICGAACRIGLYVAVASHLHSRFLMEWTDANLSNINEAARRLLSRLQLAQYRFSVVPGWSQCRMRVQYAAEGEWRRAKLRVSAVELVASQLDLGVRSRLLRVWAERLNGATDAAHSATLAATRGA
jgi:hypothetical protein